MPSTQPTPDSRLEIIRELIRDSDTFEAKRYWSLKAMEIMQENDTGQGHYAQLNKMVSEDRQNGGAVIAWGLVAMLILGIIVGWITCRSLS